MIDIVFESHGTTADNEAGIASGANDVSLSDLGRQQAKELGERRGNQRFDTIFCSNMKRSYKTAYIAFGKNFSILKDERLRECDYGEMNGQSEDIVKPQKPGHIDIPFPGGESYKDTTARMKSFLIDLLHGYNGRRVMIIGHRATQYGLENLINGVSLQEAVSAPWQWQPGWTYDLETLD